MQLLYDSESFTVLHLQPDLGLPAQVLCADGTTPAPVLPRHGFEIVDKYSGKEVYLDGAWAELFQQQIHAWQRDPPSQDEVEETLTRYATLAQNPIVVH